MSFYGFLKPCTVKLYQNAGDHMSQAVFVRYNEGRVRKALSYQEMAQLTLCDKAFEKNPLHSFVYDTAFPSLTSSLLPCFRILSFLYNTILRPCVLYQSIASKKYIYESNP